MGAALLKNMGNRPNAAKIGRQVAWLSIFTSASTLLCCALPALLVALGAGAALATVVGAVPQIVWASAHKPLVFACAGVTLAIAGYLQFRVRAMPCPTDALLAKACARQRRVSNAVYCVSLTLYLAGASFAYLWPYLEA